MTNAAKMTRQDHPQKRRDGRVERKPHEAFGEDRDERDSLENGPASKRIDEDPPKQHRTDT